MEQKQRKEISSSTFLRNVLKNFWFFLAYLFFPSLTTQLTTRSKDFASNVNGPGVYPRKKHVFVNYLLKISKNFNSIFLFTKIDKLTCQGFPRNANGTGFTEEKCFPELLKSSEHFWKKSDWNIWHLKAIFLLLTNQMLSSSSNG